MGNENTRACCEKVQKDGGRSADGSRLLGNAHLDDQDGEAGDGASAYRRGGHGEQGADNPKDDPKILRIAAGNQQRQVGISQARARISLETVSISFCACWMGLKRSPP